MFDKIDPLYSVNNRNPPKILSALDLRVTTDTGEGWFGAYNTLVDNKLQVDHEVTKNLFPFVIGHAHFSWNGRYLAVSCLQHVVVYNHNWQRVW